jgi:peptidoglycan hydrolase-like protein with peptidoglycan-binding domain|tara:strand:- start:35835 stop:37610 length:1776 start_codon:yes stop_codon:yes gene_type:complete
MYRTRPIIGAAILAGLALATTSLPAQAAREAPDRPSLGGETEAPDIAAVRQVQTALASLGLYAGFIDGKLNQNLTSAIRLYQQQAGLKVTGRITDALRDHLDRSLRVSRLLRDLDNTRRKAMDDARKALMAHPATRDLIEDGAVPSADAARDPTPCFDKPTVRCLLAEAFESAKAVTKRDLRDWALGEILAAQARAGLMTQAMETTRRIQDPRLIMVALRDIAQAQARAGRGEEALAAAEIIPESRTQIEALAVIADTQARHGYFKAAQDTAGLLYSMARHLKTPSDQVTFATRAAVTLYRAGDRDTANAALYLARVTVTDKVPPPQQVAAWRQVAGALADLDRLDDALVVADVVNQHSDKETVMIAAAQSAIRAARLDKAMDLAHDIDAERYRVLVLGEIAVAMARTGDRPGANAVIDEAFADAEAIGLPFARSYAVSRLVLALSDMARIKDQPSDILAERFVRARDAAEGINDPRLRGQVLFEISAQQRRAGMAPEDAQASEARAIAAAAAIPSVISRVWIHGDVATLHARANESDLAWVAFHRAMAEARRIDNSWARARAMAKMAQTLIDLVTPKTAATADEMSKDSP